MKIQMVRTFQFQSKYITVLKKNSSTQTEFFSFPYLPWYSVPNMTPSIKYIPWDFLWPGFASRNGRVSRWTFGTISSKSRNYSLVNTTVQVSRIRQKICIKTIWKWSNFWKYVTLVLPNKCLTYLDSLHWQWICYDYCLLLHNTFFYTEVVNAQ